MLARASEVAAELKANPPPRPADEIAEAVQFLQWIAADNFTLLGARDYAYTDSEHALEPNSAYFSPTCCLKCATSRSRHRASSSRCAAISNVPPGVS